MIKAQPLSTQLPKNENPILIGNYRAVFRTRRKERKIYRIFAALNIEKKKKKIKNKL
jgi:hypothetical protein